jgi:UDP-N-acetylglucosamine acyltransferase
LIDPTARVHPDARIGPGVEIGPYSIIGAGVELGDGACVGPHVVVRGPARIGSGNRIFQFCSIGDDPQDRKYRTGEESRLEIGNGNVIREFCTINRGTSHGDGVTRIGDGNWIMATVHIAHDCSIGSHVIIANNTALGGHVRVEDHAVLSGYTAVHQFCRVGSYAFSAIGSVIVRDVPPFLLVSGRPARPRGLNREGLRRHDFAAEEVRYLKRAYRLLYREGRLRADALRELALLAQGSTRVSELLRFVETSKRGIVR